MFRCPNLEILHFLKSAENHPAQNKYTPQTELVNILEGS